jgi:hypothetical protein
MLKVIAVLRSLAALVVLFLMLRASPIWPSPSLSCDEQRLYYYRATNGLLVACGIAVGWLAVEAIVTWFRVIRQARKTAAGAPLERP